MAILDTQGSLNLNAGEYEAQKATGGGLARTTDSQATTGKALEMYDTLMGKASGLASEMMAGKVPDDVQKQIKAISAEKGNLFGVRGQAARALQAKDLGLTSLDLANKGAALGTGLSELSLNKVNQDRTYDINVKTLMNQVRGLDLEAARLNETSRQFNVDTKMKMSSLLASTISDFQNLGYKYAATPDINQGGADSLTSDYQNLISNLRSLIG